MQTEEIASVSSAQIVGNQTNAVRQIIWKNLGFFILTTLVTLIGAPLYLSHHSLSAADWALFTFFTIATGMSITVGYHRLYSHRTFQANPFVHFLVLFFGAAAFEQSAMDWSSQHRDHHRFVDTDLDPYSIKKGFFYAHIGWLIFWKHNIDHSNCQDLAKNKMLVHQDRHYMLWSLGAGILTPVLIGALWGHALAAFIFSVCARLTLVYHATFCINSVCHTFGRPTYDFDGSARDHWFVAFLTNGEGYHSFHHRFPGDYRNGVRWYHWDPSKWMINVFKFLGLAHDVKQTSKFLVLKARFLSENQMMLKRLEAAKHQTIQTHYENLLKHLHDWENSAREYQKTAQKRFQESHRLWKQWVSSAELS